MKSFENLTIGDYFGIVRRRIWYMIITTVLVTAGAAVYVWRMPNVYKSETTILVSGRLLPEDYIRSLDRRTSNEQIEFVSRQLQSRTFLERLVREFQLGNPEEMDLVRSRIEILPLSASAFKLGFYAAEPNLAQAVTRRLAEMVIQLNDSAGKEKVQVADQFLEEQQRLAASELAQVEEKLFAFQNKNFHGLSKAAVSSEGLRELQAQLQNTEAQLAAAVEERKGLERRLEDQRQLRTAISTLKPQNSPPARVTEAPVPQPSLQASPLDDKVTLKRAELATASTRYTPTHPVMTALARELKELEELAARSRSTVPPVAAPKVTVKEDPVQTNLLPELDATIDLTQAETQAELVKVKADIAKAEVARKDLASRVFIYQARLNPNPEESQELTTLEREHEAAQQQYKYFSDRKTNSGMAARVDASADNEMFKVIDQAFLPKSPVRPNRQLLGLVGCLAGLGLGFGAAFAREFLDNSLHDEASAAAELKLPILAGIPIVDEEFENQRGKSQMRIVGSPGESEDPGRFYLRNADSKVRSVILDPLCMAGEPFRLIHAKLSNMNRDRRSKTILITSSLPSEGKTFIACCLAGVLAREPGRKVLLIDGDLRTGSAGKTLGVSDDGIGLNDLLRGEARDRGADNGDGESLVVIRDLESSVLKCGDVNLYFLPSGTSSKKPGELFNGPELERLLREAGRLFDWVIIDSPPVLALADANLLAPMCDATLFVVGSGKTNAALVKDAIHRIGPERIHGLLMNRIRSVVSSYHYAYHQPSRVKKLKR